MSMGISGVVMRRTDAPLLLLPANLPAHIAFSTQYGFIRYAEPSLHQQPANKLTFIYKRQKYKSQKSKHQNHRSNTIVEVEWSSFHLHT